MRIGIDAKWYYTGNISGRVVIVNLVRALASMPALHEYVIILDARDQGKPFPYSSQPNFEIVYYKSFTNQLGNLLSPIVLRSYHLDVCIYQYFAPLFSPFKRVMYIHDIIFESNPGYFSRKERLYFKLMKLMALRAHGVVTVSKTEKQRLKRFGYIKRNTKLIAIHNGIGDKFHNLHELKKEEIITVKKRYNLPPKYILYLGRINERKNIPMLIKAFAKINLQDISLVIAGGPDWSKHDINQVIVDAGVTDRVVFTGFIEDSDISILYRLASAFCYLSFDEGFGLPVAEAMACGIPVVVSDTAIHREVCGSAGFYANPNDSKEVAQAIESALNNSEMIHDKTKSGLEITKNYQWSKAVSTLVEFVEQL